MATSNRPLWAAVALVTLTAPGCTRIDNALASVPIFAFMREAPSFDPYEHPLPPPPGAVPFITGNGEMLPPMEASEAAFAAFEASPYGQNALAQDDPAALALGQVMFERHCAVCHGTTGTGDGPVAQVYGPGFVPPLTSGAAIGRSDAYIYAVIRAGRARMPSYGARTTHIERWAIVNYVNTLQSAGGAVPAQGAATTQAAAAPTPGNAQTPDTAAAADTAAPDTTAAQNPAQAAPPADTTVTPAQQ
ncbi:MAG TPA: cytochrome c [Longimicrobiales bacterium]|nr:cytochrome c [Longimicrobiales bacterium]